MKILTWNVNGLRSVLSKDKTGLKTTEKNVLQQIIELYDPDIMCLQETKCPADLNIDLPFEFIHIEEAQKKGYSGVAVFSKIKPLRIIEHGIDDNEGRIILLEFDQFYLLNTYTPNSKQDLSRLPYRIDVWEKNIRSLIQSLKKNIVFVSDFNVAPTELDIHTVKGHEKSHGFTIQERDAFATLLKECDLIDTFRYKYPDAKTYTWYSNFGQARSKNKGWRIDMALVNSKFIKKLKDVKILSHIYGSDHIPVLLELY